MLTDLEELSTAIKHGLNENSIRGDKQITSQFRYEFKKAIFEKSGDTVEYSTFTAIVTRKKGGNLFVYIPNQWFYIASFFAPLISELYKYKKYLLDVISMLAIGTEDRQSKIKEIVSSLKTKGETSPYYENFKEKAYSYFFDIVDGDATEAMNIVSRDADLLTRFASDYDWWHGEKTVDRTDFFISVVMNLAGLVQNSQSYVTEIAINISQNADLGKAAAQMISGNAKFSEDEMSVKEEVTEKPTVYVSRRTGGKNQIIYGAPGTGKSFYLDTMYGTDKKFVRRVTFHQEYTYFDFIGAYKPVPIYKKTDSLFHTLDGEEVCVGEPFIDYRFVPGPFLKIYMDAWKDPAHMYTLILEELNRANSAAVFGEIFQLLDRDIDGNSKYPVVPSVELFRYMASDPDMRKYAYELRLPSNLNLLATMNSADQGVAPMDTAFKRRWSFLYIPIDICTELGKMSIIKYAGENVYWERFITLINRKIVDSVDYVDEDRLVGPYFISPMEIGTKESTDKLLLYLWDDVLRNDRSTFFNAHIHSFSALSGRFEKEDVLNLMVDEESRAYLIADLKSPALSYNNPEDQGSDM